MKFILKFTSPYVNKASDWSLNKNKPIRGCVYIRACEFQYELLNFTTKFGTKFATFAEKLYEINCNEVDHLIIQGRRNRGGGGPRPPKFQKWPFFGGKVPFVLVKNVVQIEFWNGL